MLYFNGPSLFATIMFLTATSSSARPIAHEHFKDWAGFAVSPSLPRTLTHRAMTTSNSASTVTTSIGVVVGYAGATSNRYTLPYALPPTGDRRFANPVPNLSLKQYNASSMPSACPQNSDGITNSVNEDCLYLTIYTPKNVIATSKLPVFFFVHGGTFAAGTSNDAAFEGSNLANSQKSIVVVVQYRLGVLGFVKNDDLGIAGNFGLRDVVSALTFVKQHIRSFGGNPAAVTVVGSSSGANMVKSLFVTPSAAHLYARAILSSAPLGSGEQTVTAANTIGKMIASNLSCTTLSCLRTKSVQQILATQTQILNLSSPIWGGRVPGANSVAPIATVVDGTLITRNFGHAVEARETLDSVGKPIIFSTMANEACTVVSQGFSGPVKKADFSPIVMSLYGSRVAPLLASQLYTPGNSTDATRESLVSLITDIDWSCPTSQIVSNMTQHQVYLAQFNVGVPYSPSTLASLCQSKASHQDDLLMLFNNSPANLSAVQRKVQTEIQARYAAFVHTGKPNVPGSTDVNWQPVTGPRFLNMLVLGANNATGASEIHAQQGNCAVSKGLYGQKYTFDLNM